mmetsp:Transcript_75945/g.191117  ORF Transcript_75945/g.191117 Transcript_75945/m.191117 type:complete len:244 (+) Transcript_75945:5423-6154(+)
MELLAMPCKLHGLSLTDIRFFMDLTQSLVDTRPEVSNTLRIDLPVSPQHVLNTGQLSSCVIYLFRSGQTFVTKEPPPSIFQFSRHSLPALLLTLDCGLSIPRLLGHCTKCAELGHLAKLKSLLHSSADVRRALPPIFRQGLHSLKPILSPVLQLSHPALALCNMSLPLLALLCQKPKRLRQGGAEVGAVGPQGCGFTRQCLLHLGVELPHGSVAKLADIAFLDQCLPRHTIPNSLSQRRHLFA